MDSKPTNTSLVHAFIAVHITSALIFALMIFSALLFRKTKRCPTWYSFCLSWLTFSASYSLLSLAGQQFNPQDEHLCIAQTGLVYAAPFLCGCTSAGLVVQLLSNIMDTVYPSPTGVAKSSPVFKILAVVVPWSIWAAVLVVGLVFSATHPQNVALSPNSTFCVVSPGSTLIPRVTAIFTIVLAVVILSLEVAIGILLFRHRGLKNLLVQSITSAIRVFIFTLIALIAAVTALAFALTESRGIAFDIMISMTPLGAALTFGSVPDLWEGYVKWIPRSWREKVWYRRRQSPNQDIDAQETLSIRQETLVIGSPLTPSSPAHRNPLTVP